MKDMKKEFSKLSNTVIGCSIEVRKTLGPGLLESTYQQCLAQELKLNGVSFKLELPLPVEYKGVYVESGYRIDMLVENEIILELKSVEELKRYSRGPIIDVYETGNRAFSLIST